MSEDYVIVFVETDPPRPFGQRFRDSEELPHGCALIVGPPKAHVVAKAVCEALNEDVDFKQHATPRFKGGPAHKLPVTIRARYDVDFEDYANYSGRADSQDRTSRGAAYHHKAKQLEAAVRERLGLPCAEAESSASKVAPAEAATLSAGGSEDVKPRSPDTPPTAKPEASEPSDEPATATRKRGQQQARLRAKAAYDWAMGTIEGADDLTIQELHSRMHEKLEIIAGTSSEKEAEKLQAVRDSLPANPATFARYLRDAGIKRYDAAGNRTRRISNFPRQNQI